MTRTRARAVAGWTVVIALAAGGGFFAGLATLRPPDVDINAVAPATVTVVEATVGRNLPVDVRAVWPRTPLGTSGASGTITSVVVADGDEIASGDTVLTIDLRPVVVASGEVPAFRDLAAGATGRDVAQLQKLLVAAGHLRDGAFVEGKFRGSTTTAVRAWQKSTGYPVDGVVRAGDVFFAPGLPARVALLDNVRVGTRTEPGAELFSVLGAQPHLTIVQPDESPYTIGDELEVFVGEEWRAAVVEAVGPDPSGDGSVVAALADPDGDVCGEDCDVPTGGSGTILRGRKVIVPAATGPAIPAAALRTRPGGGAYVVDSAGAEREVTIVSHGDGLVLLNGIAVGTVLRLPEGSAA